MPTWMRDLSAASPEGRTLVRVSGPDAVRFLQGILSADVGRLAADAAIPAAVLTVKARLVSDAVAVSLGESELGLAVPAERSELVVDLLSRHVVMDEVEIAVDRGAALALVWGDGAAGVAGPGVRGFSARHPAPGRLVLGSASELAAAAAGADAADLDAWTRHRIQTASPAWGRELVEGRFPPERGYVHAVSYEKGCFLGQEPLARLHARGHLNWVMVRVVAAAAPPAECELAHRDRAHAGDWTSWAPAHGAPGVIGLAIVRRELALPGTALSAEAVGEVEVTSGPLGDDPGLRG